jgi:hypothetical protein
MAQKWPPMWRVELCQRRTDGTLCAMSDVGVIVTGIVVGSASGVGGTVIGGWMTGRQQRAGLGWSIAAERERAHRADKRDVYVRCIRAFNATFASMIRRQAPDKAKFPRAAQGYDEAMNELMNVIYEMALIAPVEVRRKMGAAEKQLMGPDGTSSEPFGDVMEDLISAMRQDLGMEPLP